MTGADEDYVSILSPILCVIPSLELLDNFVVSMCHVRAARMRPHINIHFGITRRDV